MFSAVEEIKKMLSIRTQGAAASTERSYGTDINSLESYPRIVPTEQVDELLNAACSAQGFYSNDFKKSMTAKKRWRKACSVGTLGG
jgi:hypothetical protein